MKVEIKGQHNYTDTLFSSREGQDKSIEITEKYILCSCRRASQSLYLSEKAAGYPEVLWEWIIYR